MTGSILLIAGETSGDMLAAHLLQGLRVAGCQLPVLGVGGPQLLAQGMDCVYSIDALAVRGYAEVLGALPRLWYLRKSLLAQATSHPLGLPSLCITVDAPDFNLAIAAKMKSMGVPTLHFISPSIWAWRRERMGAIKAAVSHMVCVFPHEPPLYQAAGVSATYVGYPLAQSIAMQPDTLGARRTLGIDTDALVVALLPGSRAAEVKHILPRMLEAAQLMLRQHPHIQFVLPIASTALQTQVQAILSQWSPHLPVRTLLGQAGAVCAAANIGVVASGTATLEAALYKLPMVITYAMPASSWAIMGHKNYLPWVGLPNILCNEWVVPELLQNAATPFALANETLSLLADMPRQAQIKQRFTALHASLRCDTQSLSARAVLRLLP
jgi:lipid-A-disaccharide synthase